MLTKVENTKNAGLVLRPYLFGQSAVLNEFYSLYFRPLDWPFLLDPPDANPQSCNLLVFGGDLKESVYEQLINIRLRMDRPSYVMGLGNHIYLKSSDIYEKQLKIDIFVPGAPPSPESIEKRLLDYFEGGEV